MKKLNASIQIKLSGGGENNVQKLTNNISDSFEINYDMFSSRRKHELYFVHHVSFCTFIHNILNI
jgi:hypothetical protein